MLKVCHITSAHPDYDVRIFYKECVSLAKAGHSVSLVIPNVESRLEKGVSIVGVNSPYSGRKERMTKTVNDVIKVALGQQADVYHLHDPELLKKVDLLQNSGAKVIYDAHEDLPRQIMSKTWIIKPVRRVISYFSERFENKTAKKCDGVIAATPFIRDRFLRLNQQTIDINNFPILDELLIENDYSSKEGSTICYVGGLTKPRGIIEILKSTNYTDASLVLAGTAPADFKNELEQMEEWKSVEYKGYLHRNDIKALYKQAKIGLVTLHPIVNYLDALPVKMFEYMAAGLPIIASNFPFWKTLIEENNCGICVNPLDPKEIASAINHILTHPDQAKQMALNGQNLVKSTYNWENEEKKLVAFYEQI